MKQTDVYIGVGVVGLIALVLYFRRGSNTSTAPDTPDTPDALDPPDIPDPSVDSTDDTGTSLPVDNRQRGTAGSFLPVNGDSPVRIPFTREEDSQRKFTPHHRISHFMRPITRSHQPETILVANCYGGGNRRYQEAANYVHHNCDIAILCEGLSPHNRLADALAREGHVYQNRQGKHSGEVIVWSRNPGTVVGCYPLSKEVNFGRGFGHDRWLLVVNYSGVYVCSTHANAVIQTRLGNWSNTPTARVWRAGPQKTLEEHLANFASKGPTMYAGDMNANSMGPDNGPSPKGMNKRLGMHTVKTGYMWLGMTKNIRVEGRSILPILPGADAHHVMKVQVQVNDK